MVQSKEWDWKNAEQDRWLKPSEDSYYLAEKWRAEGAETVLDLGCGLGRHAVYFAKQGFQVAAVDLSKDGVELTRQKCKENGVEVCCMVADMTDIPFAGDSFDRVFSYHVISHQDTSGVQHVVDEITRVLKPNGKVFLTMCSKAHCAFSEEGYPRLDENTVLKTEGAEVDVPHFFADKEALRKLFHDYTFDHVRHITECVMEEGKTKERSHYFIEATVKK